MVTRGSEASGMRIWVPLPGKPHKMAEVLTKDKGDLKWMVEEGENEFWLQLLDSYSGKELS